MMTEHMQTYKKYLAPRRFIGLSGYLRVMEEKLSNSGTNQDIHANANTQTALQDLEKVAAAARQAMINAGMETIN